MGSMSGWRAAWILGVWFATFAAVAVAVGSGDANADSTDALAPLMGVILSIPVLVVIHEIGHAAGAVGVGYRITSIRVRPYEDGSVSWDPGDRDTSARSTVALLAGPAFSLLATAVLLLLQLDGTAAAWRAGLVTFSLLWHIDNLAPIPRPGFDLQRDGYSLACLHADERARQGRFGPGERAQLDAIEAALHAGDHERARDACRWLLQHAGTDTPRWRAALLGRLALADLLGDNLIRIHRDASHAAAEASALAPEDPVAAAVHAAVARRTTIRAHWPAPVATRLPLPSEATLLELLPTPRDL